VADKGSPKDVYLPEVLFLFYRVGKSVRIVAIDPITRTEVTTIAPSQTEREDMKRLAARKLAYVIAKNQAAEQNPKIKK
jgi:hypothetical protein